jgi:hypothetical protein
MIKYYQRVAQERAHLGLIVEILPKNFDAAWVRDRNEQPGILALAMREVKNDKGEPDLEVSRSTTHHLYARQLIFGSATGNSFRSTGG